MYSFHAIYQIKGISRYVWGGCECLWVGVLGYNYVWAWVFAGVCGSGIVQVYAGMHGCALVWAFVCGMNFQNTFLRLES